MKNKLTLTILILLLTSFIPSAMAYGYGYEGYSYEKEVISDKVNYGSNYFGSSYDRERKESYEKYEKVKAIFGYNLRRFDDGSRQYRHYDYDDLNGNYFTSHYRFGQGYTKYSKYTKSYNYEAESREEYRSTPYFFSSGRYKVSEYEPAFNSFRRVYEKETIKTNEFKDETVRYYY